MTLICLIVFASAFAIDAAHAYYVRAVSDGKAIKAAFASVAIYTASTIGFVSFVRAGYVVLIPEVLGLWLGTFVVVNRQLKK